MTNRVRRFAAALCEVASGPLPPDVVEGAKLRVLDWLGAAFAGSVMPWGRLGQEVVRPSQGESSVLGATSGHRVDDAAYANAVHGHAALLEDFAEHAGHPSVTCVPAALAVGEAVRCTGSEFLIAVTVGYEAQARIGRVVGRLRTGYRAMPVLGPFGAAAATSILLDGSGDAVATALSFAANSGSGLNVAWLDGSSEVVFHAGVAARAGVTSGYLAASGATASAATFDGAGGFFAHVAATDRSEEARALDESIGVYAVSRVHTKLYSACGSQQPTIAIGLMLAGQGGVRGADIDEVIMTVGPSIVAREWYQRDRGFATPMQAQMSAKFCVAAALLGRPLHDPSYVQREYDDPEVTAVAQRVRLIPDEQRAHYRPKVEVRLRSGASIACDDDVLEEFRPTAERVRRKFMSCAGELLGEDRATALVDCVMALDGAPDLQRLTSLLRGPATRL